ncbi:MAG: hypothetical protein J7L07_00075 [Candidatus Odinarchaeota archaeon]|nr:hypothetical protein [Candidatus Odinarchaeota archaeon]
MCNICSEIEYVVRGDFIVEIRIGGLKIPARVPLEKKKEVDRYLEALVSLGVFQFGEGRSVFEDFVKGLTEFQRKLLRAIDVESWVYKEDLDEAVGTKGVETAGVLAGLTRKARSFGLIGEKEEAVIGEYDNEKKSMKYRLNPKLKLVKDLI